jgi:protocadherin-15
VTSGILTGVVDTTPDRIVAEDMDSLNSKIRYSFLRGSPPFYNDYFKIDPRTGQLEQIKSIDRTIARQFDLIVKAQEETEAGRYATAKLIIDVLSVDAHPPEIQVSSIVGYVKENSPVGTVVMATQMLRNPITVQVTDRDMVYIHLNHFDNFSRYEIKAL